MRKPVKESMARKYEDRTDYTALKEGQRRGEAVTLARGGIYNRKEELA